MRKPVTSVTVTYHSARTIGKTLAAARRCHDAQLLDVVVVDNNSTDSTREILAREADWARLVLSDQNNGFGRGCNLGWREVTTPYTIFINPDAVVEPDALRAMLHFMEGHPKAGIVGPATLCGGDDEIPVPQHAGRFPKPWTLVRNALPFLSPQPISWPVEPGAAPARAGWVCGAILMIRTDLLRRIGGFDPRFFLYWEELDLCKRVELAGFETWTLGAALTHHVVGASSSAHNPRVGMSIAKHYFQSRYYYMGKHHGWLAATAAELGEFALLGLRALADWARGRGLDRLRPRRQATLLSTPERVADER
jgi:GT2 family glycosyltransferase